MAPIAVLAGRNAKAAIKQLATRRTLDGEEKYRIMPVLSLKEVKWRRF
jgi:hypothetical protein